MRPEDKEHLQREHELLTAYLTEWGPTLKDQTLRTLRSDLSDIKAWKAQLLDAFDDADRDLNAATIGVVVVNRMLNMLEEEIALRVE